MTAILEKRGFPPINLPPIAGVTYGWRKGRNVSEGYQRGWSLQHGNISAAIDEHPLFRSALSASDSRSVVDHKKMQNIFLILTCFFERLKCKNIVEFGCFRGGSLMFMATIMKELYPDSRIFGFDTFSGMPPTDKDIDLHSPGDFSNTSVEDVYSALHKANLVNVILVRGLVQDTFPISKSGGIKFGLAHIDLDIYKAIKHIQYSLISHMTEGGYMVYDDATASSCIGATEAVEELIRENNIHSEQIYPHFVFRSPAI